MNLHRPIDQPVAAVSIPGVGQPDPLPDFTGDQIIQQIVDAATKAYPEDVITEALDRYKPITTICLFSGGHDSSVLAHRCRDHYDKLCFIDTGTAVPGKRPRREDDHDGA